MADTDEALSDHSAGYAGSFDRVESPDDMWMRMRTPSPEASYAYRGRAPPYPPETLLHQGPVQSITVLQTPYACQPMQQFAWCLQADAEADVSAGSDAKSAPSRQTSTAGFVAAEKSSETSAGAAVTADDAPSVGSVGHPHCCQAPCKYFKKARGCKDGANCSRCHICVFRNVKPKRETADSQSSSMLHDSAVPPPPASLQFRPTRHRKRLTQ